MKVCARDGCSERFEDRSAAQNRRWCSGNCRKRHQESTTGRGTCTSCGSPTGRHDGQVEQCGECAMLDRHALRTGHWIGIYLLWARGWDQARIGARVGMVPKAVQVAVSQMRAAGVQLDYRRRDNLARMDRLHDGRDAWRAERAA